MHDTDDQIRSSLQRLVDPGPVDHTRVWDVLVGRRRRRQRRRVAAATVPVLMLAGVITVGVSTLDRSGDERSDVAAGDGNDVGDDAAFELSGRTFNADTIEVAGAPRPLAPGTTITLSFPVDQASGTQRISWNAGCNNWGATLLETGPALQLDEVGSTHALCSPEVVAEQEHWLQEFFVGGPTWTLDGDTLTLTNDGTVVELTAEAEPAESESATTLSGRTFTGTAVEEGGEPRPLFDGTAITVSFPVDPASGTQHISWSAGCNSGGGRLVETEPALQLEDVVSTLMGCPDELAAQDRWLWNFFSSHPFWGLAGGTLTLTSGETVITLTAQEVLWPNQATSADRTTAEAAVRSFLSDVVRVRPVDVSPDPSAPDNGPVWVGVDLGTAEASVLVVPTEGGWVVMQVGDGAGSVSASPPRLHLPAVEGADTVEVHLDTTAGTAITQVPADTLDEGVELPGGALRSVVAVYLDRQGNVVSVGGGHY